MLEAEDGVGLAKEERAGVARGFAGGDGCLPWAAWLAASKVRVPSTKRRFSIEISVSVPSAAPEIEVLLATYIRRGEA